MRCCYVTIITRNSGSGREGKGAMLPTNITWFNPLGAKMQSKTTHYKIKD